MEFLNLFFGEHNNIEWLYASILVLFGFVLLKLIDYETRSEKNTSFDPVYWWKDNRIELFIGLIVFYNLFRFFTEWTAILHKYIHIPMDLLQNKYLSVFLLGLFSQYGLKKLRSVLKIRYKVYPSGQERSEHVGNRPDDR